MFKLNAADNNVLISSMQSDDLYAHDFYTKLYGNDGINDSINSIDVPSIKSMLLNDIYTSTLTGYNMQSNIMPSYKMYSILLHSILHRDNTNKMLSNIYLNTIHYYPTLIGLHTIAACFYIAYNINNYSIIRMDDGIQRDILHKYPSFNNVSYNSFVIIPNMYVDILSILNKAATYYTYGTKDYEGYIVDCLNGLNLCKRDLLAGTCLRVDIVHDKYIIRPFGNMYSIINMLENAFNQSTYTLYKDGCYRNYYTVEALKSTLKMAYSLFSGEPYVHNSNSIANSMLYNEDGNTKHTKYDKDTIWYYGIPPVVTSSMPLLIEDMYSHALSKSNLYGKKALLYNTYDIEGTIQSANSTSYINSAGNGIKNKYIEDIIQSYSIEGITSRHNSKLDFLCMLDNRTFSTSFIRFYYYVYANTSIYNGALVEFVKYTNMKGLKHKCYVPGKKYCDSMFYYIDSFINLVGN